MQPTTSMLIETDTIAAPATAPGRAALNVIRISGPQTRFVLETIAYSTPEPRRMSLRKLRDAAGEVLDEALVVLFPGPDSSTGEDVGELHLHGGPGVLRAVMRTLLMLPKVRLAEPGEFTRRAVLRGKLDLTEAEALGDLVSAETEGQRRQALRQLEGSLGRIVAVWREQLIGALALAEAELDFSDEGDVGDGLLGPALADAAAVLREVTLTLADNRAGERVREGFTVVIAGPPNAGKSSLLNYLAGRDIAIVSPIPGTTRDVLEVRCDIGGYPVTLVDTAGIRETEEIIEREGVRRATQRVAEADLTLWLRPLTESGTPCERDHIDVAPASPGPVIRVFSKLDLFSGVGNLDEGVALSSVDGRGVDQLLAAVEERLATLLGTGDAVITRERHRHALVQVRDALDRLTAGAIDSTPKPPELIAQDLRDALWALGRITGHVGAEDILDRIFSSFCIGK